MCAVCYVIFPLHSVMLIEFLHSYVIQEILKDKIANGNSIYWKFKWVFRVNCFWQHKVYM